MKFHFRIEYKTKWGETLRLVAFGREFDMQTTDGQLWQLQTEQKVADTAAPLSYHYALYRDGKLVWGEWDVAPHVLHLHAHVHNKTWATDDTAYLIDDLWRPIPEELPLYSSAIADCVAPHGQPAGQPMPRFQQTLQLRVAEPRLSATQRLGISGNIAQLGNWKTAVPLQLIGVQEWALNIDVADLSRPLEYKYVILHPDGSIAAWEDGLNRRIDDLRMRRGYVWVKTDSPARFNLRRWKGAGVVIPVFSLRSSRSYGVGDFGDLKAMVRWAARAGMHALQILPVNDTISSGTRNDSYPYSAISVYAFHPLYCDLAALPRLADKLAMENFLIRQQQLNALPVMDYEAVIRLKLDYLRLAFAQEWDTLRATHQYKAWHEANRHWLEPYAAFCCLRDTYGTADFHRWEEHSQYADDDIARFTSPRGKHFGQVAFYYYTQYHLHRQLAEAHSLARSLGVILKGDIPIGISPHSVEAWAQPRYFHLDSQAGAPPDDFAVDGQNWGFPTYNWEEILRDGAQWWVKRLQFMSQYFDAYRIDHVLGFFRIWDIPLHSVHGLLGQFSPALPLSRKDIEGFGLHIDNTRLTQPYITDDVLFARFGHRAELVKTLYLDTAPTPPGQQTFNEFGGTVTNYRLKPEYDTQRKVQKAFEPKTDSYNTELRDGLYALISDVLFVADRQNPHLFHPRITAQLSYSYRALDEGQRRAFNSLYNNYYYQRHSAFWYDEAMKKLPVLSQSTRMLCCAEDLGMVPECVPWVMKQLRILSLEIQTMPKEYGCEFGDPAHNPWRSVATISTHDMAPLRMWWEEDHERAQRFFNHALHIDGPAPDKLPAWLAEEVVKRHLYSPSMLCLLSLQDWLAVDERLRCPDALSERINIPANPRHYWRWRMHLTIEQLEENESFSAHLRDLIRRAGRQ